jgi:hypothetical protein
MPAPSLERSLLSSPVTWLVVGAGVATGAMLVSNVIQSLRDRAVAPGPRGLPLIGNLLDLRETENGPFVYLEELVKSYGEGISMQIRCNSTPL